ncbi:hypothetical protein RvY_07449-4 [Ramazzottius varieornatus]|uniref:Uncharacterized protein n=1 Tax=Ramazzottius varieornatus TaxID=947166 RepID=A0A1D1V4U5_RAMVA|nr:hypothetical protein RvY_07449-4 [Ramazzottius varieornatus]
MCLTMRNKVSFSIPSNRSAKVSPTPSPHGSLRSDHGTVSSPTLTTTSRLNTGRRPAKENLPDVAHALRKAEPSTTIALREPTRNSVHSMPDGMENEFRNFSKDNSATHRARVVRLLVIFAVPMIVVFVECGLIITKAVRSQQLVAETNSGIMAALQIGSLVTSLQKERGMTRYVFFLYCFQLPIEWVFISFFLTLIFSFHSESRSIYLTSLSPIAWERVLKFRNNTDLAFEHVTKWRGGPQDDKHFATGEDFRNFLLDYRRTINSTTQSLSELRWYTAAITILIKWVNRDIYMGGDNGGDLWRYFVAYELILQAKDTIG